MAAWESVWDAPLLLLPYGTDVRGPTEAGNPDAVQVPNPGGSYYLVYAVSVVAKGFPNQYMMAQLVRQGAPYPVVQPIS